MPLWLLAALPVGLALPSSITFDFYISGVQKGTCKVQFRSDGFLSASRTKILPDSDAMVSKSGQLIRLSLQAPARKLQPQSTEPEFSTAHPELIRFLLNRYVGSSRAFQDIRSRDLISGKAQVTRAELFRTTRDKHGAVLRQWRIYWGVNPESVVWTNQVNQPLEWWLPARNFEIVRRGYEFLRPSAYFASKVSAPNFNTNFEPDVKVPMGDGTRLLADVFRPDSPGRFPVILQRTCYDRQEFDRADGEYYAQRGYVYVSQSVRGRGGSEGEFQVGTHEAQDGFDTIAWCSRQPWSNSSVGMVGASYNGYCEWMAAKTRPPQLKTFISVVPMPGPPDGAPWDHGGTYISDMLGWWGLLQDPLKVRPFNDDLTQAINTLPINRSDVSLFGHRIPQFQEVLKHDSFDALIRQMSYRSEIGKIDLPVLYVDGWLDPVSLGTRMNYLAMKAAGRANQKLVWGPWTHFSNQESRAGVTDFGPDGYIDLRTLYLRWFDRWLKQVSNGIESEPLVQEFTLGENKWHRTGTWPPKSMRPTRWYLGPEGLGTRRVRPGSAATFTYDPKKHVFSNDHPAGYFFSNGEDASWLCKQPDQAIFDSQPLEQPLRLDGPIRATLAASTDAKDTDWVVTLLDLKPNGVCVPLATGFVRARYRDSVSLPSLLEPGKTYLYSVDMWQMNILIPRGDRLRVAVSSTMFPDMDRNLNTGEPVWNATRSVVAHQKIWHGRSFVELPIVG